MANGIDRSDVSNLYSTLSLGEGEGAPPEKGGGGFGLFSFLNLLSPRVTAELLKTTADATVLENARAQIKTLDEYAKLDYRMADASTTIEPAAVSVVNRVSGVLGNIFAVETKDGRKILVSQDVTPALFNSICQSYMLSILLESQAAQMKALKELGYALAHATDKAPEAAEYAYFDDYNYAQKKDPDLITYVTKGADGKEERVVVSKTDTPELFEQVRKDSDAWGRSHGKLATEAEQVIIDQQLAANYRVAASYEAAPQPGDMLEGSTHVNGTVAWCETQAGDKFVVAQSVNKAMYDAIAKKAAEAPLPAHTLTTPAVVVVAPEAQSISLFELLANAQVEREFLDSHPDFTEANPNDTVDVGQVVPGSIVIYKKAALFVTADGRKIGVIKLHNPALFNAIVAYQKKVAPVTVEKQNTEQALVDDYVLNWEYTEARPTTPLPDSKELRLSKLEINGTVAAYTTVDGHKYVVTATSNKALFEQLSAYKDMYAKEKKDMQERINDGYLEADAQTVAPALGDLHNLVIDGLLACYSYINPTAHDGVLRKVLVTESGNPALYDKLVKLSGDWAFIDTRKSDKYTVAAADYALPDSKNIKNIEIHGAVACFNTGDQGIIVTESGNPAVYKKLVEYHQARIELKKQDHELAGKTAAAPKLEEIKPFSVEIDGDIASYETVAGQKVMVVASQNKKMFNTLSGYHQYFIENPDAAHSTQNQMAQRTQEGYLTAGATDTAPDISNVDEATLEIYSGTAAYVSVDGTKKVSVDAAVNKTLFDQLLAYQAQFAKEKASLAKNTQYTVVLRGADAPDMTGAVNVVIDGPVAYYETAKAGKVAVRASANPAAYKKLVDMQDAIENKNVTNLLPLGYKEAGAGAEAPEFDKLLDIHVDGTLAWYETADAKVFVRKSVNPALFDKLAGYQPQFAKQGTATDSSIDNLKKLNYTQAEAGAEAPEIGEILTLKVDGNVASYEVPNPQIDQDGARVPLKRFVTASGNKKMYDTLVGYQARFTKENTILAKKGHEQFKVAEKGAATPKIEDIDTIEIDGPVVFYTTARGDKVAVRESNNPELYKQLVAYLALLEKKFVEQKKNDNYAEAGPNTALPPLEEVEQSSIEIIGTVASYTLKDKKGAFVVTKAANQALYEGIVQCHDNYVAAKKVATDTKFRQATADEAAPALGLIDTGSIVITGEAITFKTNKNLTRTDNSGVVVTLASNPKLYNTLKIFKKMSDKGYTGATADFTRALAFEEVIDIQIEGPVASCTLRDGNKFSFTESVNPAAYGSLVKFKDAGKKDSTYISGIIRDGENQGYTQASTSDVAPDIDRIKPDSIKIEGPAAYYEDLDGRKVMVVAADNKAYYETLLKYRDLIAKGKLELERFITGGYTEARPGDSAPPREELLDLHISGALAFYKIAGSQVVVTEWGNKKMYDTLVKYASGFITYQNAREAVKKLTAAGYTEAGKQDLPEDVTQIKKDSITFYGTTVVAYQTELGIKVVVDEAVNKPMYDMIVAYKQGMVKDTVATLKEKGYVEAAPGDGGPRLSDVADITIVPGTSPGAGLAYYQTKLDQNGSKVVVSESTNKALYDKMLSFAAINKQIAANTKAGYALSDAADGKADNGSWAGPANRAHPDGEAPQIDSELGIITCARWIDGKWQKRMVVRDLDPLLYKKLEAILFRPAGADTYPDITFENDVLQQALQKGSQLIDGTSVTSVPDLKDINSVTIDEDTGMVTLKTGKASFVASTSLTPPALYEQALKRARAMIELRAVKDASIVTSGEKVPDHRYIDVLTAQTDEQKKCEVLVYFDKNTQKTRVVARDMNKDIYDFAVRQAILREKGNEAEYAQYQRLGEVLNDMPGGEQALYVLLTDADPVPDMEQIQDLHTNGDGNGILTFKSRNDYKSADRYYMASKTLAPKTYAALKTRMDAWDEINRVRGPKGDSSDIKVVRADTEIPKLEDITGFSQTAEQKALGVAVYTVKAHTVIKTAPRVGNVTTHYPETTWIVSDQMNSKLYSAVCTKAPAISAPPGKTTPAGDAFKGETPGGIQYADMMKNDYQAFQPDDALPLLSDMKQPQRTPVEGLGPDDKPLPDLLSYTDGRGKHVIMQSVAPAEYATIAKQFKALDQIKLAVDAGYILVKNGESAPDRSTITDIKDVGDDVLLYQDNGLKKVVAKETNPAVYAAVYAAQTKVPKKEAGAIDNAVAANYKFLTADDKAPKWSELQIGENTNFDLQDAEGVLRYKLSDGSLHAVSKTQTPKLYVAVLGQIRVAQAVAKAKKSGYNLAPVTGGNGGVYFQAKQGDTYFKSKGPEKGGGYYFGQMEGNYSKYVPDYLGTQDPSADTPGHDVSGPTEVGHYNGQTYYTAANDGRPNMPNSNIKLNYVLSTDFDDVNVESIKQLDGTEAITVELNSGEKFIVTREDSPDLYQRYQSKLATTATEQSEALRSNAGVAAATSYDNVLNAKTDDGSTVGDRTFNALLADYKKLRDDGKIKMDDMNDPRARLLRAVDYYDVWEHPDIKWPKLDLQNNNGDLSGDGLTPRQYMDSNELKKLMARALQDPVVARDYQTHLNDSVKHLPNRQELAKQMDVMMSSPDYHARMMKLPVAERAQAVQGDILTLQLLDPEMAAKYMAVGSDGAGEFDAEAFGTDLEKKLDIGNHLDLVPLDTVVDALNTVTKLLLDTGKSIDVAVWRGGGVVGVWNDYIGGTEKQARTENMAKVLQELHRKGLDIKEPKNWIAVAQEAGLVKGKELSAFTAFIGKAAPYMGSLAGLFSLAGAIRMMCEGKNKTTDEQLKIAQAIVSFASNGNAHFKVAGALQEFLTGGNIATALQSGTATPWNPRPANPSFAYQLFVQGPEEYAKAAYKGLTIESDVDDWVRAMQVAGENTPNDSLGLRRYLLAMPEAYRTLVLNRFTDVTVNGWGPFDQAHGAPDAVHPPVPATKIPLGPLGKGVSYAMAVLMPLTDLVGGGLGGYFGVKSIIAGNKNDDDLQVAGGAIDIVGAAAGTFLGGLELAALFTAGAEYALALASPIGWAIAGVAGIASFIINLVRDHQQTVKQRNDRQDLIKHVYQDGVGRPDVKPSWA